MKILTITADKTIQNMFYLAIQSVNSEIIAYSSLIKALDNLDEIQPDIIIINVQEFPRHWKILAQFLFINTLFHPYIAIFSPTQIHDDEAEKASALQITVVHSQKDLTEYLQKQSTLRKKCREQEISSKCAFINPYSKKLVTGKIIDSNQHYFTYQADFLDMIEHLSKDTLIEEVAIKTNNIMEETKLKVISIQKEKLVLEKCKKTVSK